MAKIKNDKYYTPKILAQQCVNKVEELCQNITEFIEPSAGEVYF